MRDTYRNGDEIYLKHNGCDGCDVSIINGTICHEHGCPEAWKDSQKDCADCGCGFLREQRHEQVCPDCVVCELVTL